MAELGIDICGQQSKSFLIRARPPEAKRTGLLSIATRETLSGAELRANCWFERSQRTYRSDEHCCTWSRSPGSS
jgi:hypothetical protein